MNCGVTTQTPRNRRKRERRFNTAFAALLLACTCAFAQSKPAQKVNQDAAIAADFEKRVADYMKLRQSAETGLPTPKSSHSSAQIATYQQQIANRIRLARPQVQQGDIFSPQIADLFRRLVSQSMNGPQGTRIRKSYARAEPIRGVRLQVNQAYPDRLPLQSMPPSLLINLPKLPKELEYRFVDHELVLRDIAANLIIDLIPDLTTPSTK